MESERAAKKLSKEPDAEDAEQQKTCFNNCRIYRGPTTFRCSGCHIAMYCSRICQKEHWYIAHKVHCKFLSGTKKHPDMCFHNDRSCRECQFVDYPSFFIKGCPYKEYDNTTQMYKQLLLCKLMGKPERKFSKHELVMLKKLNLPFELGEITNNYVDNIDRTFGEMITILAHINMSVCISRHKFRRYVYAALVYVVNQRAVYWDSIIKNNSSMYYCCFKESVEGTSLGWREALEYLTNAITNKFGVFLNLWNLFLLKYKSIRLKNYITSIVINQVKEDIVERTKEVSKIIEDFRPWTKRSWANAKHLEESILLTLYFGDPSFNCMCSNCGVNINFKTAEFVPIEDLAITLGNKRQVMICHDQTCGLFFCCGSILCLRKVPEFFKKEIACNFEAEIEHKDRCDFCCNWTNNPHRCKDCKCKVYCSKDCQIADWRRVHYKVCHLYQEVGHRKVVTRDITAICCKADNSVADEIIKVNFNRYKR